ncbi:MAG: type II secretion system protein GspE, partial [Alphaproteobacteria bacterium]
MDNMILDAPAAIRTPVGSGPVRLGEMLVRSGKLGMRDLERALVAQQEMGSLLGHVLVRLGLVSEIDVARTVSEQLGIPLVAAEEFPTVAAEVPGLQSEFLTANNVYPLRVEGGLLEVVMAVPQDAFVVKALHLATGLRIRALLGIESDIEKALSQLVENGEVGADDEAIESDGD